MKLYYIIHDPSGDYLGTYEGMDQATVESLIQETGFPFDSVNQATYEASLPIASSPITTSLPDPNKAILDDPSSTTDQKVNALIAILGL